MKQIILFRKILSNQCCFVDERKAIIHLRIQCSVPIKGQRGFNEWPIRNTETVGSSEITLYPVQVYLYRCTTMISEQYPPRNILNSPYLVLFSFLCTDSPALLHRCSGMLNIRPRGSDKAVLLQGKSMVNL